MAKYIERGRGIVHPCLVTLLTEAHKLLDLRVRGKDFDKWGQSRDMTDHDHGVEKRHHGIKHPSFILTRLQKLRSSTSESQIEQDICNEKAEEKSDVHRGPAAIVQSFDELSHSLSEFLLVLGQGLGSKTSAPCLAPSGVNIACSSILSLHDTLHREGILTVTEGLPNLARLA